MNANLEERLKEILFNIGKEIKIHKIDSDNTIIEIDYDKYTIEIMEAFREFLKE
jgi:hypothetical protein